MLFFRQPSGGTSLHVGLTDVVDGAVVAAQDEEGPSGVVAADGNHILVLTTEQHTNARLSREALKVKSAHFTKR